jgi:hypothetical protein
MEGERMVKRVFPGKPGGRRKTGRPKSRYVLIVLRMNLKHSE